MGAKVPGGREVWGQVLVDGSCPVGGEGPCLPMDLVHAWRCSQGVPTCSGLWPWMYGHFLESEASPRPQHASGTPTKLPSHA